MKYGPEHPEATYTAHAFEERVFDTGEGWDYEKAMSLLQDHFQIFAVDLRGQGRSSRTPGRYTLDNMGNDLARFIALGIRRPVIFSGLSSGKYLGDQWSAGDWQGMQAAAPRELPPWLAGMVGSNPEPPQNLKEYDPEWARAFWTGSVAASCDHARMLARWAATLPNPV